MAKCINQVRLMGYVGGDPEVRAAGQSRVANCSLATSTSWKDRDGNWQEKTQWHRLVFWNNEKGRALADTIEKHVKKGDRLYVEGKIEYRTWDDREGIKRYATDIVVSDFIVLSPKNGAANPKEERATREAAKPRESLEEFPEALKDDDDDLPF